MALHSPFRFSAIYFLGPISNKLPPEIRATGETPAVVTHWKKDAYTPTSPVYGLATRDHSLCIQLWCR